MKWVIAAVVNVFVMASLAPAQPLADQVPANALLYVGWSGSEKLGSAYDQSHLKAFLAASDLPELFTEFLPKLSTKVSTMNPQAGGVIDMFSSIGSRMWRHPTALYFGGVDFTNPRKPQPIMAVICDAGDEAAALTKDLQTALDAAGKTDVQMKLIPKGTIVTLWIGPEPPGVAGQPNLAVDGRFKEAFDQLQKSPVAAAFIDLEGIVALINRTPVRGQKAARDRENWNKLRDALALDKLKTLAWAGAFEGKDWSSKAFLAAPAPRTGILSILDAKPVSDDILQLIPATATIVGAGTFDPGQLLTGLRATAGKVDPTAPQKIDENLDRFRTMTGLDLQKDLLDPLGEQWAFYSDPTMAGSYAFSGALINKLDDPAKADESLAKFAQSMSNLLARRMGQSQVTIAFRQTTTANGTTIHYLGTPLLRPSWAVKDGVLYAGLFPQVVASAAAGKPAAGKSILENQSFAAMRQRLGGELSGGAGQVTSIKFIDLPKTAPMMYPAWMFLSGYAGLGDLFGVPAPAMMLPPLTDLLPNLAPAAEVSWVDEKGWHSHGVTPFPGATLVGSDPTMTLASPLVLSFLLPSLNRSREAANRVVCSQNERQIGQAILLYANENKGKYPPDLGTLIKTQDITAEAFVCPSSGNTVPPEIARAGKDQQAKWANDNSSYVYVGAGMNFNAPADAVVLYERSDNHNEDGLNFLYGDGHTEWQSMNVAQQLIKSIEAHEAIRPGAK